MISIYQTEDRMGQKGRLLVKSHAQICRLGSRDKQSGCEDDNIKMKKMPKHKCNLFHGRKAAILKFLRGFVNNKSCPEISQRNLSEYTKESKHERSKNKSIETRHDDAKKSGNLVTLHANIDSHGNQDERYEHEETRMTIAECETHTTQSETCENKLGVFLQNLYDEAMPNEIVGLCEQVKILVQLLLKDVENADPRMRCVELVPTGSAFDGTKVAAHDEFDFLAVLGEDRGGSLFDVDLASAENDGFAHVNIEDKTDGNFLQGFCFENKVVSVSVVSGVCSFRDQFRILFHEAIHRHKGKKFYSSGGYLLLWGFSVSINGPECTIEAIWEPSCEKAASINVSIDVCPALRSDQINVIKRCDVPSYQAWKSFKRNDSLYLIPKPVSQCTHCFKLVFAVQDMELVKDLSPVHRKCLVILKYLARMTNAAHFCTTVSINSFIMKTVLIHHSFSCTKSVSLSTCMRKVLSRYLRALRQDSPLLPSVFILERNVLRTLAKYDKSVVKLSENIIDQILKFFQEMEHEDSLDYIVDSFRELKKEIEIDNSKEIKITDKDRNWDRKVMKK